MEKRIKDVVNFNMVNTILVVGNGFDLQCEVKSRFSDYYSSVCLTKLGDFYAMFRGERYEDAHSALLSDSETINFWSFLFYIQYYVRDTFYKIKDVDDSNWFDIERLVFSALNEDIYGGFKLEDYISDSIKALRSGREIRDQHMGKVRNNPYIFFPFLQSQEILDENEYLMKELRKFENSFRKYMIDQIGSDYPQKCHSTLLKILGDFGDFVDVINFNYSVIDDSRFVHKQTNVHGRLCDEEIVIGIDSDKAKNGSTIFTKTFRNLHRIKEPFELPDEIANIVFYGHSLAEADFSYFYSIFDMYNLYNGSLKLLFLYSDYCDTEEENERNHTYYVNRIFNLINTYSSRAHGETNLLHRLLLEGRISVKRL